MLRLSLRTKFFLYSNTLIIVTMGLVAVLGIVHERQARYEGIVSRARSLTEDLAIPITDALMYEELGLVSEGGLIESTIDEVVRRNRDLIRYVVVTDRTGRVTHTNRWELLGRPFPRALGPDAVERGTVSETVVGPDGERLLEVRPPLNISTRCWGSLAAGFSLASVEQRVRAIAEHVAIIALIPDDRKLHPDGGVCRDADPADPRPQPDHEAGRAGGPDRTVRRPPAGRGGRAGRGVQPDDGRAGTSP